MIFFFGKYSQTKSRYLNITNPFSEEVKLKRFEFQGRKGNDGFDIIHLGTVDSNLVSIPVDVRKVDYSKGK
jgi:hypothetical protein